MARRMCPGIQRCEKPHCVQRNLDPVWKATCQMLKSLFFGIGRFSVKSQLYVSMHISQLCESEYLSLSLSASLPPSISSSPFLSFCFCLFYVYEYSICIYVWHQCAWYTWKPEESNGSLGTEATDSCEPHVGAKNRSWVLCKRNRCF